MAASQIIAALEDSFTEDELLHILGICDVVVKKDPIEIEKEIDLPIADLSRLKRKMKDFLVDHDYFL